MAWSLDWADMDWSSAGDDSGKAGDGLGRGDSAKESVARPFLKWAGGKSQLLPEIRQRFPKSFKRYWEPFIGGGAVFFALAPKSAVLLDINEELIGAYRVVRDDVEGLIAELAGYRYDRELYYQVREWDRREDFKSISPVRRAARFIFLNKTCFNGLHRVNSKGHFNVPFGRYSAPRIVDRDGLRRCSEVLQRVEIEIGHFTSVSQRVERGDLVYFDPPYVPLSDTSSFTSYAKGGFSADDQMTLRDLCVELDRRGVMFVLSNSDNHTTRELYRAFRVDTVPAARAINSKASRRGAVDEVIVANF